MEVEFIAGILRSHSQAIHKVNKALITLRTPHPNCIWDSISLNTTNLLPDISFNFTNSMSPWDEKPDESEADNSSSNNGRWNTAFFILQLYVLPVLAAVALANNTAIVLVAALSRAFRGAIFPSVRRILLSIALADIGSVLFYHLVIWLGMQRSTPYTTVHPTCVAMFIFSSCLLRSCHTFRLRAGRRHSIAAESAL